MEKIRSAGMGDAGRNGTVEHAVAGVLTESIWQLKRKVQSVLCRGSDGGAMPHAGRHIAAIISTEFVFWVCTFTILSLFLYYSSFGLVTFHGIAPFWQGYYCGKKAAVV